MKRRDVLKGSLAAGALALLPRVGDQGAPQNAPGLGRRYRNLIVCVYQHRLPLGAAHGQPRGVGPLRPGPPLP
ncbi:MAG: twin-arginine translocation signal domain-containing protein [Thermus sp.]